MPSRREFEKRVAPAVSLALRPGEPAVAAGKAFLDPGLKTFAPFAGARTMARVRHYWLALTNRQFIFVSMGEGSDDALPWWRRSMTAAARDRMQREIGDAYQQFDELKQASADFLSLVEGRETRFELVRDYGMGRTLAATVDGSANIHWVEPGS